MKTWIGRCVYRDDVEADGLQELLVTTRDKLTQFLSAWPWVDILNYLSVESSRSRVAWL